MRLCVFQSKFWKLKCAYKNFCRPLLKKMMIDLELRWTRGENPTNFIFGRSFFSVLDCYKKQSWKMRLCVFQSKFWEIKWAYKNFAGLLWKTCWLIWKLDEKEVIIPQISFLSGHFFLFWTATKNRAKKRDCVFFRTNFEILNMPIKNFDGLLWKKYWLIWNLDEEEVRIPKISFLAGPFFSVLDCYKKHS